MVQEPQIRVRTEIELALASGMYPCSVILIDAAEKELMPFLQAVTTRQRARHLGSEFRW